MAKNLLARVGHSIFLATAPFLYSGCFEQTSAIDKTDSLNASIEKKQLTGYDSGIVPFFKLDLGKEPSRRYD